MERNDISKQNQIMMGTKVMKGIIIALVAAAFFTLVVFTLMYCWNYAMPSVFGLPMISFWQALAMLIVARILFWTGWRRGGWNRGSWQKWNTMNVANKNLSSEEKDRIKKYWEHKCGRRFGGGSQQQTENQNTNEQTQS